MKVKKISRQYYKGIESGVNKTLEIELSKKRIIDIKYTTCPVEGLIAFIHYEDK